MTEVDNALAMSQASGPNSVVEEADSRMVNVLRNELGKARSMIAALKDSDDHRQERYES